MKHGQTLGGRWWSFGASLCQFCKVCSRSNTKTLGGKNGEHPLQLGWLLKNGLFAACSFLGSFDKELYTGVYCHLLLVARANGEYVSFEVLTGSNFWCLVWHRYQCGTAMSSTAFPTLSTDTSVSSATSFGFLTHVKWNLSGFSFHGTSLGSLFVVPCWILLLWYLARYSFKLALKQQTNKTS